MWQNVLKNIVCFDRHIHSEKSDWLDQQARCLHEHAGCVLGIFEIGTFRPLLRPCKMCAYAQGKVSFAAVNFALNGIFIFSAV
jgi:hypothetical protein